jgi:outer membrane protein
VEYALEHNISVRQADVQARIYALTYKQSKLSQFPSLNMQNSGGYQFGRSIDPSTNEFTTEKILFTNHSVNLNFDVFNWFSKKNQIASDKYQAMMYAAGAEKSRNDIALNVANAYLQILLSNEQINISDLQVKLSLQQLNIVEKQVRAGALPELNLAEVQSQLATDSSNLITANSNYTRSVLQLKAILNIPADEVFVADTPDASTIPVLALADLDPAAVYAQAIANLPQQKINDYNLQSAVKYAASAKGLMYPSLSLFGQLDTRYSDAQKLLGKDFVLTSIPIGSVTVSGTPYVVTTINEQLVPTGFTKNTYFRQLNNNFSQAVGLGLRIPIFNGNSARINWQKAKLNVTNAELQKEQGEMTIKQDIYLAHADAVAAMQKFNASKKEVELSQKAYDFSKKRFDVGLVSFYNLLTNQNNLFIARINLVSAQYDYIFKMKLLEFYKGQGLKL